jgi:hypothetical protein
MSDFHSQPVTALLPCPFCGGTSIDPAFWATAQYSGPGCDDCGATAETTEGWNARSASAQSAPPILASHSSGERLPSSDAAVGGADTRSEAVSERAKVIDECAQWHEDQSRLAMNSLHCGDNSLTNQMTRIRADWHDSAAASLRALAAEQNR